MDKKWKRYFLKSLTWRIIGVVFLGAIVWGLTGDVVQTGVIAASFHLVRFLMYPMHEYIWDKW